MKKKKIKMSKVISNNKYMLSFVKKASPRFVFLTVAISFTALIDTLSNTWFSKVVFDSMEKKSHFVNLILIILCLMFFMLMSAGLSKFFYQKYAPKENQRITGYIRSILFRKTHNLDLMYYENPEFYDKYTRALLEADGRALSVVETISQLSYACITLLTLFSIIVYLDPILILFAVVGAILSAVMSKRLAKIKYEYDYDKTGFERKKSYVNRVFYEPQYAKELKMDSLHGYFINFYKDTVEELLCYVKNRTSKIALWECLLSIQSVVLQIIMTIFLTWRVYSGVISIGDYAALLNSTFALMFQIQNFATIIPKFYEHSLYIENFREIMNSKPVIENDYGIEIDTEKPIQIEFCNVTFSYPDTKDIILNNVNMFFSSGKKHAIVGHNGAGKSTIIKLILRLYDVNKGIILINGKDIKEYNVFSLRKAMTTVFQDFQVYAMPLSDYILSDKCSNQNDRDRVERSIQIAGLKNKLQETTSSLSLNLTREFDDKGILLSGGEKQKLAIAKAIAKDTCTILMDEASSALDPISEYEFNKKLLDVAEGKTVILISHRLSTTKDADIIFYLEKGSIIEKGSHKELMQEEGNYAQMYRIQAESYMET